MATAIAAASSGFDAAHLFGQAISVLVRESESQVFARHFGFRDGILRDNAIFVFDFHIQVIMRKNALSQVQDGTEFAGAQTVILIVCDPRLKNARGNLANRAAAIDELLRDAANFGDVKMRRNGITVREDKARELVGIGL